MVLKNLLTAQERLAESGDAKSVIQLSRHILHLFDERNDKTINFSSEEYGAMYEVKKIYAGHPSPLEVQVTFSLAYPDWLKLKASDVWLNLEELLADAQKG